MKEMLEPRHRDRRIFRPSQQQLAYLACWLDPQAPKTILGIANHIGVARRTIYNWLEQPTFVRWFNGRVARHTDHAWMPLLHRLTELALQGSIEHMKLLAQIRGAMRPEITRRDGCGFVVIGVPRPGADSDILTTPRE